MLSGGRLQQWQLLRQLLGRTGPEQPFLPGLTVMLAFCLGPNHIRALCQSSVHPLTHHLFMHLFFLSVPQSSNSCHSCITYICSVICASIESFLHSSSQPTCFLRLNEAQQSAFQDITNVANERRQLSGELEDLRSQFKAYQKVKTREICSLEHRVRILLQSQAVAGTMRQDDPPASSSSPRQHQATPARYTVLHLIN